MRIKKRMKRAARYIPLEDIKKIDDDYINEINKVRRSLAGCTDKELVNSFYKTLINGYNAAIELKTLERATDYDIIYAEIEARSDNIRPVRRSWGWRLLFRRLTNRAQDIIEERAELDADVIHTAAEKQLDEGWKQLDSDNLSKRELKKLAHKKIKEAIRQADETPTNEAFDEPSDVPTIPENVAPMENAEQATEPPEPPARKPRKNKQQLGVYPL